MGISSFKYLSPLIVYVGAAVSFSRVGIYTFFPLIYAWIIIPLVELFLKPNERNLQTAEEEIAKKDKTYDYILYLIVLLQLPTLYYFLYSMQDDSLSIIDKIGRIGSMGLLCGTFGINVGHELGHRVNKTEQWLAKISLMTSLYMHFFIEHNKGHHKHVATPDDPSSARYGEPIYFFWPRTIIYSYVSAWKIANEECRKNNNAVIGLRNEMIRIHFIQLIFVAAIGFLFGSQILAYYLVAALIGILLLETVNYIEHYGLTRKQTITGNYERAMPQHSWNSNHIIGRLMLFE
ncbi:MAG: alkane 1-monooxygenase, partial [Chitinophagaceae bacterium]